MELNQFNDNIWNVTTNTAKWKLTNVVMILQQSQGDLHHHPHGLIWDFDNNSGFRIYFAIF